MVLYHTLKIFNLKLLCTKKTENSNISLQTIFILALCIMYNIFVICITFIIVRFYQGSRKKVSLLVARPLSRVYMLTLPNPLELSGQILVGFFLSL